MRIGIDARVLDKGMTGVGRYLLNILSVLPEYDKVNEYYIFGCKDLKVAGDNIHVIHQKKSKLNPKILSPFWLNITLPKLIKTNNIELLFSPNVLIPTVNMKGVKIVSVVHDVMAKLYKEYYPFLYRKYLDLFLPVSLTKSDAIITVSEYSKKDIVRIFKVKADKIHIAYNIASDEFLPRVVSEYRDNPKYINLQLPSKYLLFVGMIEKRKNISASIKIADKLYENGSDIKLVMVGKPGFNFKNYEDEIKKRSHYITLLHRVDDELLKYVYNSAFAFIFPSFYEGFGIPPLEAMQSGIPVLASNCSSIPEVVGNGGLLFRPDDFDGFYNAIIKMDADKELYEGLKAKAVEQAKKFTVESMIYPIIDTFNLLKKS